MTTGILDNLTPQQLEAVTHIDGPMLVVAGAGSGKTRVVTSRIAYLIDQGIRPHQILAMTFTNKAAGEMKERVEKVVGVSPRWVGTFHSMCARFLRFDLDRLAEGRDSNFTIYDDSDQNGLVKTILKNLRIDDKRFTPRFVLSRISRAKSDMTKPDDFAGGYDEAIIGKVYAEYEKQLRQMNALDFDDLLVKTVELLEKVPGLKEVYHDRFRYILIDEYQDTNRAQYRIMRLLTGEGKNVHVTGDPDQSIYSWRGAEYRNIMDFTKDFPGARLVRLERNYRSTKCILAVANALIANNEDRIEKSLYTKGDEGTHLRLAHLSDDRTEASWVADHIKKLKDEGRSLSETAVFYRTNAQSRSFEEAMMREGIPYQVVGGVRFYQRKEIKDILAHLKILVNPRDQISFRRITDCRPTGVGAKTIENIVVTCETSKEAIFDFMCRKDFRTAYNGRVSGKLKDFADWCARLRNIPLAPVKDCVEQVIRSSGLIELMQGRIDKDPAQEDRIENLYQFLNRAEEFTQLHPEAELPAFLEDVALVADIDSWDRGADQLSLMTLHAAKGLEFPFVFIVGLEEGLLPHGNSRTKSEEEEERRLFYVGITRAQESVAITHASSRFIHGQVNFAVPSRFLRELPEEFVEFEEMADPFSSSGFSGGARGFKPRTKKHNFDDLDDFGFDDDDGFLDDFDPHPDYENIPDFAPELSTGKLRNGDIVLHPTFGKGKILSVSKNKVVVQFFVGGTKLLSIDHANLKRG